MIHKVLALPLLILLGSFVMAKDTPILLIDTRPFISTTLHSAWRVDS